MSIRYACDSCGADLGSGDSDRYMVKMEAFAAVPSVIELSKEDLSQDQRGKMNRLLKELSNADPDQIEDQTYRSFRFDLCPTCHQTFLKNPLPFQPK